MQDTSSADEATKERKRLADEELRAKLKAELEAEMRAKAEVEAKEADVRRELGDILDAVDFDKTVLGGFSYGAATTALGSDRGRR